MLQRLIIRTAAPLFLAAIAACQPDTSKTESKQAAADSSATATVANTPQTTPVAIIFDTDCGPDYDDVGALAVLHALTDRGESQILGIVSSNLHPLVVPTVDVINTYFGRPNLPIGAPKTKGVNLDAWQHWPDSLVAKYPHDAKTTAQAPDAVALYRKILAAQADTSVTIVTVGFLTNLRNLLESKADANSQLDGKELVRRKVKQWVCMGGKFPAGKEFNIEKDAASSKIAIDNWPTPVLFSGFEIGEKVKTGLRLIKVGAKDSPVRHAFAINIPMAKEDKNGRMSWDQTAVLVAVRGAAPYYDLQKGKFITKADGSNGWQDDPNGMHTRLVQKIPPDSVAYQIETLMMHQSQKPVNGQ